MVVISVWCGDRSCVTKIYIYLLALHFPPRVVTTSPGGGETVFIQTVVAAAVCYVPGRNNVADGAAGAGMVDAVDGALQNPDGAAL